jgi:hypothetical protein
MSSIGSDTARREVKHHCSVSSQLTDRRYLGYPESETVFGVFTEWVVARVVAAVVIPAVTVVFAVVVRSAVAFVSVAFAVVASALVVVVTVAPMISSERTDSLSAS